jgi:hypothetical protein
VDNGNIVILAMGAPRQSFPAACCVSTKCYYAIRKCYYAVRKCYYAIRKCYYAIRAGARLGEHHVRNVGVEGSNTLARRAQPRFLRNVLSPIYPTDIEDRLIWILRTD